MNINEAIKVNKFRSEQHKVLVNIIYTSTFILNKLDEVFKDFDVTRQQYNVLRILRGQYPKSINASSIKDVMLDKNPDITRLCVRLLDKKLIVKAQDPVNKRNVKISITHKGLALLSKIDPKIDDHSSRIILNDADANLLSDLLDKSRGD
jgi:DNA-binding MarR family transcriptional regulator